MKRIKELYKIFVILALSIFIGIPVLGQSFVLDVQYNPMSFKNSNKTILVNTGNSGRNQGSVHKYTDVLTVSGINVYAHLTLLEVNNAFITNFDDDVETGDINRFQPRIGTNNDGGYILYQLEFFNAANDSPVFLYNYWLTAVDIDGGDDYTTGKGKNKVTVESYREYVEVGGYTSYQIDETTQLTITTNQTSGTTRFKGREGSLSGVTFDNTAAFIANYSNPNNKFVFALGITDDYYERYFSVQLGAPDPDGPFDDPVIVQNPLPVAIDDVGTTINSASGGITVNNVLTNDLFDGDPVVPSEVNISLVSPASNSGVQLNTTTGQVTVAPGTPVGNYVLTYKICLVSDPLACDIANVYVEVIQLNADLAITKTASKNPVKPGEALTYTITVQNNGPNTASNVVVQDVVPNSLENLSMTPSEGSWSAPNWSIGTLANGASVTLTISATVKSTASGNIVNTANVTSTTTDPNSNNNSATSTITVTPLAADLQITKTASKNPVKPGDALTYIISVKNNGPDAATNVSVADVLPSNLTFVSATPSKGTWNAPNWTIGNLANGEPVILTIATIVKASASGNIFNTATVTTSTTDPISNNNTASSTVTVTPLSADLQITKTASKNPVKPGDALTYTITVTNNGPDAASNVSVADALPSSLNIGTVTASQGSWTAPNWTIGTLANGATVTLTVASTVKSTASGNIVNTAVVSSDTDDPTEDNNSSTVTVAISDFSADLQITKTASANPVKPGDALSYTITVTNNGPDAASSVIVNDVLPASLNIGTITLSQGTWTAPNWTIGTLANGASVSMTVATTVKSTASGNIVNIASVSGETADPNTENNSATSTVAVSELSADLQISKTASQNPVQVGDNFTYTVSVKNNGPDAASSVVVNDVLPSDLNLLGANPSTGSWSAPNWTIGNLANGATVNIVFNVSVKSGASGTITNTATVSAGTADPNQSNNTATKIINVQEDEEIINNFPATGYGTLAYEDLWPGKGDYDFNDLVLDYKFEIITNINNKVDQVKGTFIIKAFGASYHNGFGFQLSDNINASDLNVSGYSLTENFINLNSNGTESGQSKPTIIVYDNAYNQMAHPGIGIGVNTEESAPYVTPDTIKITINFASNVYGINDLDIANFNPFIIVNKNRGIEVHLPDYPPTNLADQSYFGTHNDDSNAGTGKYYKTENNLPWAIHIYETFDYPGEKKDITWAHLKFAEWATSGGINYPDWYQDKSGYRNESNIYQLPF